MMLNKVQQLLNFMGQRGMRDECAHLCYLEKIAQTQQGLFPHPIISDHEFVFNAGRNDSGDYRCAGCGQIFTEDDISGFYTEDQISDSDLEDAPVYTEKFPDTEYNPNTFMPNYKNDIPELLNEFLMAIRKIIQGFNRLPPQRLEFETDVGSDPTLEQGDPGFPTHPPEQSISPDPTLERGGPNYEKQPRKLKIIIDDITQIAVHEIKSISPWYAVSYNNLINQGFMAYVDGEELTGDSVSSVGQEDWEKIKSLCEEKIKTLYKVSLGKNNTIDDARSALEKIGDQIKSYQSVLPYYIRNIAAETNQDHPNLASRNEQQFISGLMGRNIGRYPRSPVFKSFLFAEEGESITGSDFVDVLIESRILYSNDFIMQLQSSADEAENVISAINTHVASQETKDLPSISAPITSQNLREAHKVVKYPICEECASDLMDECGDCNETYLREDLPYLNSDDEPICEGCAESYSSCDNCGTMIYTGDGGYDNDYYLVTEDGEIFCRDCKKEVLGVDTDTMKEHLDSALKGGVLGLNIPHETGGETQTALFPIPSVLLARAIPVFRRLKLTDIQSFMKTDESATNIQGVLKKIESQGLSKEDSLILLDSLRRFMRKIYSSKNLDNYTQDQFRNGIEKFIANMQRQIDSNNSFYDSYPLTRKDSDGNIVTVKREVALDKHKRLEAIRKFYPSPVDYRVTESRYHDSPSFTVVMDPSSRMIDMAKLVFGEKGEEAWNLLSRRGTQHHRGSIAYARISKVEDESYVINNLQRDSDIYNLGKALLNDYKESDPVLYNAIKWWDKKLKFWHVQFLLTLAEFAKTQREGIYLTPFAVQKRKWSSIPDRNRDVYSTVPEEMNVANKASLEEFYADREEEEREDIVRDELFPRLEEYNGEVESVGSGWELWRLAEDFGRKDTLHKIARFVS